MTTNNHTKQLEALVLEMAKVAEENQKVYFIGGGLAIDLFVGRMTRNHHDIDFHPMLEDTSWWISWFENKGYVVKNRSDDQFPETWWVFNSREKFIVDMWPFQLEHGVLRINKKGIYVDARRRWDETKIVEYKHIQIRIENPYRVLEQKTRHVRDGQKYRPVDIHDFKLLGIDSTKNLHMVD